MVEEFDVHYLSKPALVHALKSRAGKEYTARCGVVTENVHEVSGWAQFVTCNDCDGGGQAPA